MHVRAIAWETIVATLRPFLSIPTLPEDAGKAAADCDAQKIWSLVPIWLTDLPDKPNKTDPSE
jgi:hypothetical protein